MSEKRIREEDIKAIEWAVSEIRKLKDSNNEVLFGEAELKGFEELFFKWVSDDFVFDTLLRMIVEHWIECGMSVELDIIKFCKKETPRDYVADKILEAVRNGDIGRNEVFCIVKAVAAIVDWECEEESVHFEEHREEWDDDWVSVANVIIDSIEERSLDIASYLIGLIKKGSDGETILTTVTSWIQKGAYNYCDLENIFSATASAD